MRLLYGLFSSRMEDTVNAGVLLDWRTQLNYSIGMVTGDAYLIV